MDNVINNDNVANEYIAPNVIQPIEKRKKERFSLCLKDKIFALSQIVFCICLISFGLWKELNFGFTLFYLIVLIFDSIYLFNKNVKPSLYGICCGILSFCGGFVYTVTSNYTIRLLLIPVLFVLCVIWFTSISGVKIPEGDLGLFSLIVKNGIGDSIANSPASVVSVVADENGKNKNAAKVLIGFLCAVPVLCIVIPLLISADEAFETLLSNIAESIGVTVIKVVLGLILSVLVISFSYTLKKKPFSKEITDDYSKLDGVYVGSFLSVLSVCYITYLFSQLAYFFSAFKKILPLEYGLNYSEYARRGFFELCVVSLINLAIIFAVLIFTKKKNEKLPVYIKIVCIFISLFTLVLCATSISKMFMYISVYGLTVLRIGTSCCMLVIAITFIALVIRLFNTKVKVLHTAVLCSAVLLIALGLINVNKVVAQYNYNAYVSGDIKEIDVDYMSELGAEGIEYLDKLTHSDNNTVAENALDNLYWAQGGYYYDEYVENEKGYYYKYTDEKIYDDIFYYNIAREGVYEIFEKTDFSDYINNYAIINENEAEW